MRPLEITLVAIVVIAGVLLTIDRWRVAGRLLVAVLLAVLIAHLVLEGAHWQMIPAYAAAVIFCLVALLPAGKWPVLQMATVSLAILLAATGVAFCWAMPLFRLPRPTGPYLVGTTTLYMKDSSRSEDAVPGTDAVRELMVQIWYPAESPSNRLAIYRQPRETRFLNSYQSVVLTDSYLDAPVANSGAPFPIVLFNPGWRGRRTQNTFLTEELASQGYVVASIDHTYNAGLVAFPDGRVVRGTPSSEVTYVESSTPERVRAIWDKELWKWVADERFVLNRLEEMNKTAGSPWYGRLDSEKVAAVGHSFGGAASVAFCARDAQIRGAVNMDGWYFGAIRARGANQPLLWATAASEQPDARPDPSAKIENALNVEDSAEINASIQKFGGYILAVKGVNHEDFTDQPLLSPLARISQRGSLPAWQIQDTVRTYVLAFLNKTLRGEDPWLLRATASPSAAVTLTKFAAAKDNAASSKAPPGTQGR